MAHTSTAQIDDEPVRQRIGPWTPSGVPDLGDFDPTTNFVVRAAAGSGKTTALVGRMVALVRTGVPVEDLTAITFTRKAAGEMSARFSRELDETRRALPPDSRERARVATALGNVQSTFIGTIHAFCSRLLRERPLDAGLPPDFTAGLTDREERQLRNRAWTGHLQDLYAGDGDELEQITACGLDPQDLSDFFKRLCAFPDLELFTDGPDAPPDFDSAIAEAREKMREWSAYRPDNPEKGADPVMAAFDKAHRMLQYLDLDTPSEQADFLSVFANVSDTEKAKVKTTYWKGDGSNNSAWAKTLRDDLLPSLIESTIQPVLREWEAYVHRVAVQCTAPAVERYRDLRRREGMLTFHDLLSLTRDMLRDRPHVRRAVQERYPRLLVDEFQDTDPLQAEILSFLSSQNVNTIDWRACRPRNGSLFIVGDDKQSIYRFRRADKDVFEAFRTRIDNEPNGKAVDLTKNFRSRAPICHWCNDAFGDLFSQDAYAEVQAEYVPFNPQRPAGPEGTALRVKPIGDVYRNNATQIAEQDARQIAQFIEAARSGDADSALYGEEEGAVFQGEVAYSDFLILTRVRSRLSTYTEILAQHGIPYTVTGSRDMSESADLKAVVDVLRAAMRPDDPLAATAYLKGLLVGASDTDLYHFVKAGGNLSQLTAGVSEEVGSLPDETRERFEEAIRQLEQVRQIIGGMRPAFGMERIVEETGLIAGAAHPEEASQASTRAGAVLRLLHFVQSLGSQGLGWGEVLEELDLVLQGEEEMDGMTLETGRDDAVRIMNVHQAKGLEAPVVFLADPYSSRPSPAPEEHVRREHDDVVVPVARGEGIYSTITHAPRGWYPDTDTAFMAEEERQEQAEEHRLLYVAATRAERMLVVSTYPKKAGSGYWGDLAPHLTEETAPELVLPEPEIASVDGAVQTQVRLLRRILTLRATPEIAESNSWVGLGIRRNVSRMTTAQSPTGTAGHGFGKTFGTVLHQLLERMIRHRDIAPEFSKDHIRHALVSGRIRQRDAVSSEELDSLAGEMTSMLDAFRQHAIWAEVQVAGDVRTEYSFALVDAAGDDAAEVDTLTRGTIDLVYQADGLWTLVDFKSDRLSAEDPDADAERRAQGAYADQIRAYASAWDALGHEPIERAGLWFASSGQFVDVDV